MSKCIIIVEINFNRCFKTGCMAQAAEAIHDPSLNVKNPIGTDKVTKIRHVGTLSERKLDMMYVFYTYIEIFMFRT